MERETQVPKMHSLFYIKQKFPFGKVLSQFTENSIMEHLVPEIFTSQISSFFLNKLFLHIWTMVRTGSQTYSYLLNKALNSSMANPLLVATNKGNCSAEKLQLITVKKGNCGTWFCLA